MENNKEESFQEQEYQHMLKDVMKRVKYTLQNKDLNIEQFAENCAEVYVTTTLGLSSTDFNYQSRKDSYIEIFMTEYEHSNA